MPESPVQVVTRFAPSPTGELHIGHARTVLYAWAFARRHDGMFQLRFEDTDLARSSDASAQGMLDDLDWLGFLPDNYEPSRGVGGIPRQSERHQQGRYNEVIQQLLDAGEAYEDDDTVRFKMGDHRGDVTFTDAVYGTIETPAADLEDFIIRKGQAGGFMPTFHLAVVVDDHDFGCTHVLRGQGHLSNTPKHAALCDALGWPRPVWAHLPDILTPGGKGKMGKRDKSKLARQHASDQGWGCPDGIAPARFAAFMAKENHDTDIAAALAQANGLALPEIDVADFRRSGYLPAALLNYIALLGWNPGQDLEHFSVDYLAEHFSLDRINKANGTFDRAKLASFNQDAILRMSLDDFEPVLRAHFQQFHPGKLEQLGEHFRLFSDAYWERSKTLDDPATLGAFVFSAPTEYNAKAVKKNLTKNENQGLRVLAALREKLEAVNPWDVSTLRETLEQAWQDLGGPHMGHVAQPLRVALTGTAVSPEIDATLALLGRDETLSRIDRCLAEFAS